MKKVLFAAVAFMAAFAAPCASAQTKEVTFAYQDMLVPYRTLIDSRAIEKATGYKINWRQFGGGGDVIRAMASGDVALGELGSSPAAAAASQGMDLQIFWILDNIDAAEQLVARDKSGVASVTDLRGKKVATPFVSTSHYSLLLALGKAGVNARDVRILNMRPPEIAAAWERGDIDAAFVWDPVLSRVKQNGKVLVSAGDIGKEGRPTFDALAVDRRWGEQHQDFMVQFVRLLARSDEGYRNDVDRWTADSPEVRAVAKVAGANPKDVPAAMRGYDFPSLEQQASNQWLGGGKDSGAAKALLDTAKFLKEQGRVSEVLPDYGRFVTDRYVRAAMQQ